ncbi:T6SS effector BTH_I2691 family protein [Acinetobacter gerneri]|uniref:T6SS effector BTH_I2691 family protein n=1 Tax=Acinetobacter gerneri TaxID=202952 RepID=UPI0032146B87
MAINDKCDFCHREDGLQVLITRKIIAYENIDNILLGQTDKESDFFDDFSKNFEDANCLIEYRKNIVDVVESNIKNRKEYEESVRKYNENVVKYGNKNPELVGGEPLLGTTVHGNHKFAKFEKFQNIKSEDKNFYYGLSTLRKGYLYVFQKHLNRWEEYSVTEEGFLKRIDQNNFFGQSAPPNDNEKPCDIISERAAALTITIPRAKKANKIWFQFSDVPWTLETKLHNKKNYSKFMQAFDVSLFLGSRRAENAMLLPNCTMLAKVDPYIEFQTSKDKDSNLYEYLDYLTLGWHNNDLDYLNKYLASISDADLQMKLGAMFAIEDPVGMAIDISSTISGIQTYTEHYTDAEKTLNDIDVLKIAVTKENDDEFLTDEEEAEQNKINAMAAAANGGVDGRAIANIFKSEEKILEEERELKKTLNRNAQLEWQRKYLSCLNLNKYKAAQASRLKHLDEKSKNIKILDKLLVKIWGSQSFINSWKYNYQKNNFLQSIQYVWNIVRVLFHSPNMPATLNYLSEMTTKNVQQPDNCILNAICLNNDKIKSAMLSSLNYNTVTTMPWGDLIGRFNAYIQEINISSIRASFYSGYNVLILKLNPVIEFIIQKRPDLKKISERGIALIHPVSLSLAAIQNKKLYDLEIVYKHKNHYNTTIKNYFKKIHIETYGTTKGFSDNKIQHLISQDPFWQSFYEINETKGTRSLKIPVIASFDQKITINADEFFKGITDENKQAALLSAERQQRLQMLMNPTAEAQLFVDAKASLNKITLTGNLLLQSWAVLTMWNDPSLKNNAGNPERTLKLAAGFGGITMATMEGISHLLNKYVVSGAIANQHMIDFGSWLSKLTDAQSVLWRVTGASIGIIFAAYDFYNGYKAYKDGEISYGQGMMISGGVVGTSAIAFAVLGTSNPLGWVLLVVGIGISVVANLIRDDDIQKWLYRCQLGKIQSYTPFVSYAEQTAEYNEKFIGNAGV